jgi:hypothetical protein
MLVCLVKLYKFDRIFDMKSSSLIRISRAWILAALCLFMVPLAGWSAEEKPDEKNVLMPSFGAHMGTLLPNQIEGVTEMLPMWGARVGFPRKRSIVELGGMHANSLGVTYTNASVSIKGMFPMEGIYGLVYGGLDGHYYKGPTDTEFKMTGGGHLGGGLGAEVAEYLHFRGEMKFNVNPGTSLYIGFGFEMLFPQEKEDAKDKE